MRSVLGCLIVSVAAFVFLYVCDTYKFAHFCLQIIACQGVNVPHGCFATRCIKFVLCCHSKMQSSSTQRCIHVFRKVLSFRDAYMYMSTSLHTSCMRGSLLHVYTCVHIYIERERERERVIERERHTYVRTYIHVVPTSVQAHVSFSKHSTLAKVYIDVGTCIHTYISAYKALIR